ncbi:MAG: GH3 auxin-responsive promoter family protein, partial [Archangium sp.]|nr:GH3 auxin-responsive promoter family protein [Archangium sp.]
YLLGDVMEVCGFHNATPRVRFVRKFGAASNLIGEKLLEEHVTDAVAMASAELRLESTFFTLAPRLDGALPGYTLHFEPRTAPLSAEQLAAFEKSLQAALRTTAIDYELNAQRMSPVLVRQLTPGSYDAWRQRKIAAGVAEAQLKCAHLVTDHAAVPDDLAKT